MCWASTGWLLHERISTVQRCCHNLQPSPTWHAQRGMSSNLHTLLMVLSQERASGQFRFGPEPGGCHSFLVWYGGPLAVACRFVRTLRTSPYLIHKPCWRRCTCLHGGADVLDHLPEQLPEEARQQRPPQVQPLRRVVIPVVLRPPAHGHQQQPVHNVAQEECLCAGSGVWDGAAEMNSPRSTSSLSGTKSSFL